MKAKMDAGGTYAMQATSMSNTVQTISRSKLATIKSGNAVYAALLETPRGRQWEVSQVRQMMGGRCTIDFRGLRSMR